MDWTAGLATGLRESDDRHKEIFMSNGGFIGFCNQRNHVRRVMQKQEWF